MDHAPAAHRDCGSPLDTVVFDLGGVLISWDPVAAFTGVLTAEQVPGFLEEIGFEAWNHAMDAGRSVAESVADLRRRFPHHGDVVAAYPENFAATVAEMPDSVALLRELHRRGVRLLALTNWSAELFEVARREFAFLELFEAVVVSGQEQVAKPDRRLFELLLERHRVDPATALYVDDRADNVDAAAGLGLHALRFSDAGELRAELRRARLLA